MSVRRRVTRLTRERVCAAALALVDDEGLDALTMRRLAARLHCEAMSLYHYVKHKADLLDAVHAAVLGDLQPETNVDYIRTRRDEKRMARWRRELGGMARALRSALLAHPNVVPLFITQHVTAPEAVQTVGRLQMRLALSGFSSAAAERALHVIGMFTIGHAIFERSTRNDATFEFGLEALLDALAREHRKAQREDD